MSLLEVLGILGILGLLALLSLPLAGRLLASYRLEADALRLEALLREARAEAVRRSLPLALVLEGGEAKLCRDADMDGACDDGFSPLAREGLASAPPSGRAVALLNALGQPLAATELSLRLGEGERKICLSQGGASYRLPPGGRCE